MLIEECRGVLSTGMTSWGYMKLEVFLRENAAAVHDESRSVTCIRHAFKKNFIGLRPEMAVLLTRHAVAHERWSYD